MNHFDWTLYLSAAIPILLAVIPWMIRIHTKLEVVAHKVTSLCKKIDALADDNRDLQRTLATLSTRLETHELALGYLSERVNDL